MTGHRVALTVCKLGVLVLLVLQRVVRLVVVFGHLVKHLFEQLFPVLDDVFPILDAFFKLLLVLLEILSVQNLSDFFLSFFHLVLAEFSLCGWNEPGFLSLTEIDAPVPHFGGVVGRDTGVRIDQASSLCV